MFGFGKPASIPDASDALPGRETPVPTADTHYVNGRPLQGPYPADTETVIFGLGCFWGAERKFWEAPGVYVTAAGYAGGHTPNPTYNEVCTGGTGHNEVVLVVYRPADVSFEALCAMFFELHDPTQGMRQGNDTGTQYRSGIYCTTPAQLDAANAARSAYDETLKAHRRGPITTEILEAPAFYFAEEYHQQYLAKVPHGYCGLAGTGVAFEAPVTETA